jgi:DNA polymerase I
MNKKDLVKLLNNVNENSDETVEGRRVLVIDALNLFFRNFAILNVINVNGAHIGGLGGFFRSLGFLIKQMDPSEVYIVFDGLGSSQNRKNIIPEYKSNRHLTRVNSIVFDDHKEEEDSKIDQIRRIVPYLQTLPVKVLSLDNVEADDVIAYLSKVVPTDPKDKFFIVSSDKDYIQLINKNTILYRPIEKEYYTEETVIENFEIEANNFLTYKVLMGDNSDKIKGVKGLGPKKLFKLFPELRERKIDLEDIFDISEEKIEENIIYARILQTMGDLRKNSKVMDLSNPMLSEEDKELIDQVVLNPPPEFKASHFLALYEEDQLGKILKNIDVWLRDVFEDLNKNKNK